MYKNQKNQFPSFSFSNSTTMNKLVFPLFLALFFAACQNTPKTASETPAAGTTAVPAPPALASPEQVQQASSSLATGVKMAEELRAQMDALPAKIKKEKAKEIAGIYATLEGLMEKQTMMLTEIKAASAPAGTPSATQETSETGMPNLKATQVQE